MTDTTTSQADNSNQVTPADLATTAVDAAATAQTVDTSAGTDTQADATDTDTTTEPEGIDTLPPWAQKELRDVRDEARNRRFKVKELEEQLTTTQTKTDEILQQVGKAFGFIKDEDTEKVEADQLMEKLTTERDQYQEQLREYRQRDAIREASTTAKITDHALLEAVLKTNNAFNALDINTDDYQAQVAHLITEAVQQHPALAQVAPTASGVDTNTTNSGAKGQLTREDLANMTSAEINQAAREGKLNHLMK